VTGLHRTIALTEPILSGLGFGADRLATIETDDPDALGDTLGAIANLQGTPRPASFTPLGTSRELLRLALRELQRAAPTPADVIALPAGAPLGGIAGGVAGGTLLPPRLLGLPPPRPGRPPAQPPLPVPP